MNAMIKQSLKYFSRIVEPDEGSIQFQSFDKGELVVIYNAGSGPRTECTISSNSLSSMIRGDLGTRGLVVNSVVVHEE